MKYLVDSMEMRAMDRHSIDTIGIPSIVLMERAATVGCSGDEGASDRTPLDSCLLRNRQ